MTDRADDIDRQSEQKYVTMLYDRLDGLREQAAERLAGALRDTGGTPQARSQRDASVGMYTEQLAQLNAVENGLCFGRLDFDDGDDARYIGRIGIFDEDGDYDPLLIDWRAPAARPFYLATAAVAGRAYAGAGTSAPGGARWSASTTRCSTSTRRPPAPTRG